MSLDDFDPNPLLADPERLRQLIEAIGDFGDELEEMGFERELVYELLQAATTVIKDTLRGEGKERAEDAIAFIDPIEWLKDSLFSEGTLALLEPFDDELIVIVSLINGGEAPSNEHVEELGRRVERLVRLFYRMLGALDLKWLVKPPRLKVRVEVRP